MRKIKISTKGRYEERNERNSLPSTLERSKHQFSRDTVDQESGYISRRRLIDDSGSAEREACGLSLIVEVDVWTGTLGWMLAVWTQKKEERTQISTDTAEDTHALTLYKTIYALTLRKIISTSSSDIFLRFAPQKVAFPFKHLILINDIMGGINLYQSLLVLAALLPSVTLAAPPATSVIIRQTYIDSVDNSTSVNFGPYPTIRVRNDKRVTEGSHERHPREEKDEKHPKDDKDDEKDEENKDDKKAKDDEKAKDDKKDKSKAPIDRIMVPGKLDPNICEGQAEIAEMKWRAKCKTGWVFMRPSCWNRAPSPKRCCPVPKKQTCETFWPRLGE